MDNYELIEQLVHCCRDRRRTLLLWDVSLLLFEIIVMALSWTPLHVIDALVITRVG